MSTVIEQLNLTPQERRVVVIIAVVVFVVLNALLVWPHFKDLGVVRRHLADTRKKIVDENKEVLRDEDSSTNGYKVTLNRLQRQQGGGIGNQQIQLQRTVSDQAIKTGVNVDEIRPVNRMQTVTNQFYDEQSVKISFECQESQLVNFLYNVGNDPAMIRVQELNLRTADQNRYRLKGDAILTANYSRQPAQAAAKSASPAAPIPAGKVPAASAPPPMKHPMMIPRPAPGPPMPH